MSITEQEVRRISDESAKKAVREILVAMGADPDDPIELQKDFAFLRSWREATGKGGLQAWLAIIGVVVVGLSALIWTAVTKGG